MIAERKGRTVNHGKEAIEMALQRIASVAKILRKGAIVMLRGRSQLNENLQGDECILQQISALRRENRFLKVGLIFCLVLSALPYITGFQPETIRVKRVVTEMLEFINDGKTVMSITAHPKGNGLVISDRDNLPSVWVSRDKTGGLIGVYNNEGKISALISILPDGGSVSVLNNNGKFVASMDAKPEGGIIGVMNNNEKLGVSMAVTPQGNRVIVYNKDGKPVADMREESDGGSVEVRNNDGELVAVIGSYSFGGGLALWNEKGKLVWSAP
jgi:hypothetical protein